MRFSASHATDSQSYVSNNIFPAKCEHSSNKFVHIEKCARNSTEMQWNTVWLGRLTQTRFFTNEIKWCVHELCDIVWDDCISINVVSLFYMPSSETKNCNALAHLERTVTTERRMCCRNVVGSLCAALWYLTEGNTCNWHVCRRR